jgi:hypothetical protein
MEVTEHWSKRIDRNDFIQDEIGFGVPIRTFRWDKGHPNGAELHTITNTGIIVIRNERTKKLVTTLIARPGQIYRYYANENEVPPKFLMDIAKEHTEAGYNYR